MTARQQILGDLKEFLLPLWRSRVGRAAQMAYESMLLAIGGVGEITVDLAGLARDFHKSADAARKWLRELELSGLIDAEPMGDGRWHVVLYPPRLDVDQRRGTPGQRRDASTGQRAFSFALGPEEIAKRRSPTSDRPAPTTSTGGLATDSRDPTDGAPPATTRRPSTQGRARDADRTTAALEALLEQRRREVGARRNSPGPLKVKEEDSCKEALNLSAIAEHAARQSEAAARAIGAKEDARDRVIGSVVRRCPECVGRSHYVARIAAWLVVEGHADEGTLAMWLRRVDAKRGQPDQNPAAYLHACLRRHAREQGVTIPRV